MKKIIAGFMTALMALVPLVSAVELGSYPTFLADDGVLDALVVIGKTAAVGDVVGAVDIAARLAEVGATDTTQTCSGASGSVTGVSKDNVGLASALSTAFPSSGVLKTAHYSGLKDNTYSWRGNDYDYREQVDIGNVAMSHDLGVSNVNGTEKMIVESGDVKYSYVFDKALTGTGSTTDPNYSYPINIQILGKDFAIVGIDSNQVKMLHGSIGTATATTPVVYGDYSVYADLGSDNSWTRVIIKDEDDNTVDTLMISKNDNKQSTTGLTIQVNAVKALQDGTVVGADLVVGPTTEGVTKTYDVTADVTSTGTASDKFPGETVWGIQVSGFASTGAIAVGDSIEVVYKPDTTQYLLPGSKISLPNNYGDLGFDGWNTDKFATITITPLTGTVSAYNYSADTQAFGNLGGFEIASDVSGSIVDASNTGYTKAYVLFNYSRDSVGSTPAFVGFFDSAKSKILVNGTITAIGTAAPATAYISKIFNTTAAYSATNGFSYPFKLSYGNAGDTTFYLNVSVGGTGLVYNTGIGATATTQTIVLGYKNRTAVSTAQAPEFKLGATAADDEAYEINATTHSTLNDASQKSQEIVDDSGLILVNTASYGGSDKVVFKVPFKALTAVVYFGKQGTGVSGDTVSYTSYPSIPLTSALARLDDELTASDKNKNLIAVGGSCVNSVSAEALELTFPTCGAAAAEAYGITEGQGAIKVVASPYKTGKYIVLVAGYDVDQTRAAASALQMFEDKLDGVTASSVVVTGTVGAPTVTEA